MTAAIRIENLSKRYQIGVQTGHDQTMLREVLVHAATAPLRRMKERLTAKRPHAVPVNGTSHNGHTPDLPSSNLHPPSSPANTSEFWALKDVSFEIQPGEVVGIIGRNGAGKSTLLKILSRIVEPTSGRIELRGRVGSLLEVGTGFHPELTGRENVFLNGAILGLSRREIRKKFDEIVDFSGVERFIDTPVKRYSSGMYVRLAFAVAAHMEPEILIVDEVLAVGDAEFQSKCLGKLQNVADGGRTVIFVSHNLPAIRTLTTQCAYLRGGNLIAHDETSTVINQYLADTAPRGSAGAYEPVERYRRAQTGTGPVRFRRIWLDAPDAEPSTIPRIESGAPVTLSFEIEADRSFSQVAIMAFLLRDQNQRVVALLSDDHGFNPPLRRGLNKFQCVLSGLPLAPGAHRVTAGVLPAINVPAFDMIDDYPMFEVELPEVAKEELHWRNRSWGAVYWRDLEWAVV